MSAAVAVAPPAITAPAPRTATPHRANARIAVIRACRAAQPGRGTDARAAAIADAAGVPREGVFSDN